MSEGLEFLKSSYKFYLKKVENNEKNYVNKIEEENIENDSINILKHFENLLKNRIYKDGNTIENEFVLKKTRILTYFKYYMTIRNNLNNHFKRNQYIDLESDKNGNLHIFNIFLNTLYPESPFKYEVKSKVEIEIPLFEIMNTDKLEYRDKREVISYNMFKKIQTLDIYFKTIIEDIKNHDLDYFNETEKNILFKIEKWGILFESFTLDNLQNKDLLYSNLGADLALFVKDLNDTVMYM